MRYEAVSLALFAMMTLSCESAGRVSDAVPSSDDTSRLEQAHADTRGLGDPALPGIDRPDSTLVSRLAAALDAKSAGYKPRTHHLRSDGSPIFTNRLIFETSPYLLQHAHNPVNWYAWGDEPFERATRENKPVLLSIGYSTCHWCHVMERESFEDEEIAAYINRHYVAIKVDREERPDLDDVYMTAVQMMTGRGGWPMTVVLTPERKPFFGGTYFPARDGDRGARVGFLTILQRLSDLYENQRERAFEQAEKVSRGIQEAGALGASPGLPNGALLHDAVQKTVRSFDPVWGGFGSAPKFPRPVTYELLLRYHRRTGDEKAREIVRLSLEKMAAGGMYDHAGGGFHRYSTDRAWLVPHFEKMLYDNAQLVPLYLEAYQLTGDADFARVARETLDYLVREMTTPDGAFYSATDADSITPDGHAEEGWFFTWTPSELRSVLPEHVARMVETYYAVTDGGNFEHRNVLHTPAPLAEVASELGISPAELRVTINEARATLRTERAKRSPPLLDDKIIAAWNGLAISAFARGALVLGRDDYRDAARRAADFVLTRMRRSDGGLWRTYKDGRARHLGVLDDYAFVVQALLDTYEATGEIRWMDAAIELQRYADEHFFDTEVGGYFGTSHTHEALLARTRPLYDGAEPSGNSVAILNLLRLEELTGDGAYRRRAEAALAAFAPALAANPSVAPKMLSALDFLLDEPFEVIVVMPAATSERDAAVLATLRSTYLPNRVLAVVDETEAAVQSARVPLLEGKRAIDGRTTAYVCKKGVCKRPTSDPSELARQLGEVRRLEA